MMDRLERANRHADRQRKAVAHRRETDPAWWQDYLARNATYRRERAARDPDYRRERNMQAR